MAASPRLGMFGGGTVVFIGILMIASGSSPMAGRLVPVKETLSDIRTLTTCNTTSMMLSLSNYTPSISYATASANANSSTQYASAVASLGSGYSVSWSGVGIDAGMNGSSCTVSYQNYSVDYPLLNQSTNDSGQLSIFVDLSSGNILGSAMMWLLDNTSSSRGTGGWSGYTTNNLFTGYTANFLGDWWSGVRISMGSSHCGARIVPGICAMSFWGGLSAAAGGGSGIAQSGVDAYLWCVYYAWPLNRYNCPVSNYVPWWEFYPGTQNYCWFPVSPTDTMVSETYHMVRGGYLAALWDYTTNHLCYSTHAYGTALNFGQWQTESIPNGFGSWSIPSFNVNDEYAYAYGYPFDLSTHPGHTHPVVSQSISGVTLNPMQYNTGPCAGSYLSCFNVQ
jgi:hypothetical protein